MPDTTSKTVTVRPVKILLDGHPLTYDRGWREAPPPDLARCQFVPVETGDITTAGYAVFEDRGEAGLVMLSVHANTTLAFAYCT